MQRCARHRPAVWESPWQAEALSSGNASGFQAREMLLPRTPPRLLLLLLLLVPPLFPAAEGQSQPGVPSGLRCLNNYGLQARRVDCTWHRNQTLGEGPFDLRFSDTFGQQNDLVCRLWPSQERPGEFSCSAEGPGAFEENDEYRVSWHDSSSPSSSSSGGKVVFQEAYAPMRNIKCDVPEALRSNMSGRKCLVEWEMPAAYEAIWDALQWQLQFRDAHSPSWEQAETKTVVMEETWMEIEGSEFTPGTSYEARIRCKTPDSSQAYVSHWSEWSAPTTWNTPPGGSVLRGQEEDAAPGAPPLAAPLSVPLCLGALLLALLLAAFSSRMKSHCWPSPPSPAAFFLPLYASHQGDFQAWIGKQEKEACLRRGRGSPGPGKGAGPGLEAISPLSSFPKCLEGRGPHLLGAPDQQDQASNHVVCQGEALPGRPPLPPPLGGRGGPEAVRETCSYFPYRNALFVEQGSWETGSLPSFRETPGPPGAGARSVDPAGGAQPGGEKLTTAGPALCQWLQASLPTPPSPVAPCLPRRADPSE